MKLFTLDQEQWLPAPRDLVFPFFADAANLEAITPPWVGFEILSPLPIEMRPGALIDYRIRIHRFPMKWRTEITAWDPPRGFVDEQRRGPYRRWIHTHTFAEQDGGTLCRDHVEYAVPGGAPVNALFVGPEVRRIFAYRRDFLARRFGAGPPTART
jgi:ligand-binding SRPBCC domain-containing protein